jgi:Rieske Fe-S protein
MKPTKGSQKNSPTIIRKEELLLNGKAKPSRRSLLGWLVAGINLLVGAAVLGPVLGFVSGPMRKRPSMKWIPILDESKLAVGETKEVAFITKIVDGFNTVDRKYTVFLRRYEDRLVAFDPACTHLGCRVTWVGEKERYFCPCHGGVFDPNGEVVSGPPPKPLDQHPVKVEGGRIWIQKKV